MLTLGAPPGRFANRHVRTDGDILRKASSEDKPEGALAMARVAFLADRGRAIFEVHVEAAAIGRVDGHGFVE
ncbi:MAG: hypothetical protein RBU37_25735, partial [Myxococcota bacterium]|nr:hypothetical protein [Myxococcota bacterium]